LLSNAQKIITKFEPVCCGQKHYLINFGDMQKGTSCTEEAPEMSRKIKGHYSRVQIRSWSAFYGPRTIKGHFSRSPYSYLVCLLWPQTPWI